MTFQCARCGKTGDGDAIIRQQCPNIKPHSGHECNEPLTDFHPDVLDGPKYLGFRPAPVTSAHY